MPWRELAILKRSETVSECPRDGGDVCWHWIFSTREMCRVVQHCGHPWGKAHKEYHSQNVRFSEPRLEEPTKIWGGRMEKNKHVEHQVTVLMKRWVLIWAGRWAWRRGFHAVYDWSWSSFPWADVRLPTVVTPVQQVSCISSWSASWA